LQTHFAAISRLIAFRKRNQRPPVRTSAHSGPGGTFRPSGQAARNREERFLAYVPALIHYALTANGENVKAVQELLRHGNSKITLDVYAQARMEANVARLANALTAPQLLPGSVLELAQSKAEVECRVNAVTECSRTNVFQQNRKMLCFRLKRLSQSERPAAGVCV